MSTSYSAKICQDMLFCGIVVTIALCLGLFINQLLNIPMSLSYQTKTQKLQSEITAIAQTQDVQMAAPFVNTNLSLSDFRAFIDQKRGLVLDARPEIFYRSGHVPGAFSFPREEFKNAYAKLKATLEADKSQVIAVYCANSSCKDSELVEEALIGLGYKNVNVFRGGWSEWVGAGYPGQKDP